MSPKRIHTFRAVTLALVCAFACSLVRSQDATAKIEGSVTDPQGAFVPGVTITVTNVDTQYHVVLTTNQQGFYQAVALPIGRYRLQAEKGGFAKVETEAKTLQINQVLRLDVRLTIGGGHEAIDVSGDTAGVETVNSTLGQSVTSRPVVDLPLNGRDVLQLALLQPGVTESNNTNTGAGTFSIAGGRTDSVTFLLDGGLNNNLLDNGVVFDPNPDTVGEFRILTSNYTAEYGRNGGGIISVVTKSGTNQFHGSGFEFLRNDAFNANSYLNKLEDLPRNVLKRNQFGGTIGGPIKKNRLFFFVGYQMQRLSQQATSSDVSTFTPGQLNGDFSNGGSPDPGVIAFLQANPYFQPDPAKAAEGIIDPSKFNPAATAYIKAGLIPSAPNGVLSSQASGIDNRQELTAKFDYALSDKDKVSFTIGGNRLNISYPFPIYQSGYPIPFADVPGFAAEDIQHNYFLNASYTRTFSNALLNAICSEWPHPQS